MLCTCVFLYDQCIGNTVRLRYSEDQGKILVMAYKNMFKVGLQLGKYNTLKVLYVSFAIAT